MAVEVTRTPRAMYRYLLRQISLLPQECREYYKHYVRQAYNSHSDETDPERVQQIIQRAQEDAEWIIKKYNTNTDR